MSFIDGLLQGMTLAAKAKKPAPLQDAGDDDDATPDSSGRMPSPETIKKFQSPYAGLPPPESTEVKTLPNNTTHYGPSDFDGLTVNSQGKSPADLVPQKSPAPEPGIIDKIKSAVDSWYADKQKNDKAPMYGIGGDKPPPAEHGISQDIKKPTPADKQKMEAVDRLSTKSGLGFPLADVPDTKKPTTDIADPSWSRSPNQSIGDLRRSDDPSTYDYRPTYDADDPNDPDWSAKHTNTDGSYKPGQGPARPGKAAAVAADHPDATGGGTKDNPGSHLNFDKLDVPSLSIKQPDNPTDGMYDRSNKIIEDLMKKLQGQDENSPDGSVGDVDWGPALNFIGQMTHHNLLPGYTAPAKKMNQDQRDQMKLQLAEKLAVNAANMDYRNAHLKERYFNDVIQGNKPVTQGLFGDAKTTAELLGKLDQIRAQTEGKKEVKGAPGSIAVYDKDGNLVNLPPKGKGPDDEFMKMDKEMISGSGHTRDTMGRSRNIIAGAHRIAALGEQGAAQPGHMNDVQLQELAMGSAGMLLGGNVPAVATVAHLVPENIKRTEAGIMSWLKSEPQGANQVKYEQQMLEMAAREEHAAKEEIKNIQSGILFEHRHLKAIDPKRFNQTVVQNFGESGASLGAIGPDGEEDWVYKQQPYQKSATPVRDIQERTNRKTGIVELWDMAQKPPKYMGNK